jgi:hypothetical protein
MRVSIETGYQDPSFSARLWTPKPSKTAKAIAAIQEIALATFLMSFP